MSRRVLLLLGQSPFDPTSGAAQSMRQIALTLAAGGASVRSLSTTGCEGAPGHVPADLLAATGAEVRASADRKWLHAALGGVQFELLVTEQRRARSWEQDVGACYEQRLRQLQAEFRPEIVLTFGGDATDAARRHRLRAAGACVVFALHNLAYLSQRPAEVDGWLAPSRFLAARYEAAWNRRVDTLPPPVDPAHALAAATEPVCIAFCNPEPAKGAALVARLAERLGRERPDWPLLVIGGRVPAAGLRAVGKKLGLELGNYPNVLQAEPSARVAELLGACRVVLMPSVVEEAAGRLPLEAMANGVVPLVSDRGALPELVAEGGEVLPLARECTLQNPWIVSEVDVENWWQAVMRLMGDEAHWQARSAAARTRGAGFLLPAVVPRYAAWLRDLTRAAS